ncbi:DUF4142 domain-containing protein [Deinococcus ruber]|uniref:DUF4142 domain-containing protein n=1 Tax=Deinococcus ruber TaxID=1848197 RepID=A0A918FH25_9DEIO|nr:DUF4142 domain-containing protein [Deinococcus ruber]GGR37282.1 hypothetical protein GCM10008957_53500 [Deinococcus ruber]
MKLSAALLAFASCAPMLSADPATLNNPDLQFAQAATGSNLFEIQSSQLAVTHSSSDAVKAFAQMLIADHTAAQASLAPLADAQHIPLPTVLPPDKQLKVVALGSLNGADFDAAFIKEQTLAHQLTLSVLQNELSAGVNADLKGYATAQVPVITMHLNTVAALKP